MKIIGIVCEYNPFHLGHRKQFDILRRQFEEDIAIVCLMSGNFVQRGAPAVFHKSLRAKAALQSGADLVLELPINYALRSAEGFAAGDVSILSGFCDYLCFGTETGTTDTLMSTAAALLTPAFSTALRSQLERGVSFPTARAAALSQLGCDSSLLENPNDILAVEYCKAILSQNSSMEVLPIHREGSYHANTPDAENPSATSLRRMAAEGPQWLSFVPESAREVFRDATVHTTAAGERAILSRLRTMTDGEFEALPYGSEGLWRKLMHACRSCDTLETIIAATKSKRYTRSRIDRMLLCAFLGLTEDQLAAPAPYTRVLGLDEKGREVLKKARLSGEFLHVGEAADHTYWSLEQRCSDLYGLFADGAPEPAGQERKQRVYVLK